MTRAIVAVEIVIANATVETRSRYALIYYVAAIETSVARQALAAVGETRRHAETIILTCHVGAQVNLKLTVGASESRIANATIRVLL